MHPLIACWITYVSILNAQPKWDPAEPWAAWQATAEAWSDWFNELRRLPEGIR